MNELVRDYLIQAARSRNLVTYSRVNEDCHLRLDFDLQTDRNEIGHILGEISTFEHQNGRPLLSAIVIHESNDNEPGAGFYELSAQLYQRDVRVLRRELFWALEVDKCFVYWRQH